MSKARAVAPFTPEQVESLNEYQRAGQFHPYTCGVCGVPLVATQQGWRCPSPGCDYTQDWAHRFAISGWRSLSHLPPLGEKEAIPDALED